MSYTYRSLSACDDYSKTNRELYALVVKRARHFVMQYHGKMRDLGQIYEGNCGE